MPTVLAGLAEIAENVGFARGKGSMNLHEYQAKEVFRGYGIPVPAECHAAAPVDMSRAAE